MAYATSLKRTIDVARGSQPYSQPSLTGAGYELQTNIIYAVEFLKKKDRPLTFEELGGYLNQQNYGTEHTLRLKDILRKHQAVKFDPKGAGGKGTYAFKPKLDVRNADELLAYLQQKSTFDGTAVKDLKDGWPSAIEEVERLASEKLVLVTRNKKDDTPKAAWANDRSLNSEIDGDFVALHGEVKLPSARDDLRKSLITDGLTPTSQVKAPIPSNSKKEKKKTTRRGGKTTNVHMAALLKDYSHLKK